MSHWGIRAAIFISTDNWDCVWPNSEKADLRAVDTLGQTFWRAEAKWNPSLLLSSFSSNVIYSNAFSPLTHISTAPYHFPQLSHSRLKALCLLGITKPGAQVYRSSSPISYPECPCRRAFGKDGGSPQGTPVINAEKLNAGCGTYNFIYIHL